MKARHLLNKIEARGIRIFVENDSLRIKGEKGVVSPDLLYEIKAHKDALIRELTKPNPADFAEPPLPPEVLQKLASIAKILLKIDEENEASKQRKIDSDRDPKIFLV